jgi:hypothetical protein
LERGTVDGVGDLVQGGDDRLLVLGGPVGKQICELGFQGAMNQRRPRLHANQSGRGGLGASEEKSSRSRTSLAAAAKEGQSMRCLGGSSDPLGGVAALVEPSSGP